MNLKKTIEKHENNLSESEKLIAHFFINNVDELFNLSIKQIANHCNVSISLVTKACKKLGYEGYKDLVRCNYYFEEYDISNDFSKKNQKYSSSIISDFTKTFNKLNINEITNIATKIIKEEKALIVFATGKTKILAEYFYFSLIELGIKTYLCSSLYDTKSMDCENKIIFIITTSGNNPKIKRYLNMIYGSNSIEIIGISPKINFNENDKLDKHFHGFCSDPWEFDTRIFPMNEKFVLSVISD